MRSFLLLVLLAAGCAAQQPSTRTFPYQKSEAEWRQQLDGEAYQVLRQKGTERAFMGKYHDNHETGSYSCAGCGQELFLSRDKFDSGTGWPSFSAPAEDKAVVREEDNSYGMHRVEVVCSNCGGHLGHVFEDGPKPSGLRYCINSCSLKFRAGRLK